MNTRLAVVAGRFYPSQAEECRKLAKEYFAAGSPPCAVGGIVPHAGWTYSGAVAAATIAAVAASEPETIVIFGGAHQRFEYPCSIYAGGEWQTPLGAIAVDEELATAFLACKHIVNDPRAHAREHSIEVQLPLIKHIAPNTRIVPITMVPTVDSIAVGEHCARAASSIGRRVGFLGSTDLTHYGPAFGFEPHGCGATGIRWAKEVNDRRLIALLAAMDAEGIIQEAAVHHNACGAGAAAALVAAMRECKAVRYQELRHTCSAECAAGETEIYNSVGYTAGVFLR